MPISQATLRNRAPKYYNFSAKITEAANAKSAGTRRSAFLCHSHKDEDLAKGLVVLFQEKGITLYVDWMDHSMPDSPNKETALRIQKKIKEAEIFLFLATANSKDSRWCPWEIGYADSGLKRIYIVPTSDEYNTYGNEYLDLYPRIDTGTNRLTKEEGYAIFVPKQTSGNWLSTSAL